MDVRSCELNTHLYTVAPHYCIKDKDQTGNSKEKKKFRKNFVVEYTSECGYDEPLYDFTLNRHVECDNIERCPMNSYCNKQLNRCCVKGRTR